MGKNSEKNIETVEASTTTVAKRKGREAGLGWNGGEVTVESLNSEGKTVALESGKMDMKKLLSTIRAQVNKHKAAIKITL